MQERIKIINANKVKCKVNIKVDNKDKDAVFSAEPTNLVINAHEFAYVKLTFNPKNMQIYQGFFEAAVVDGERETASHKLAFQLKGTGT